MSSILETSVTLSRLNLSIIIHEVLVVVVVSVILSNQQ